jgi:hypothetical protein
MERSENEPNAKVPCGSFALQMPGCRGSLYGDRGATESREDLSPPFSRDKEKVRPEDLSLGRARPPFRVASLRREEELNPLSFTNDTGRHPIP